jgi:hypothetical protein
MNSYDRYQEELKAQSYRNWPIGKKFRYFSIVPDDTSVGGEEVENTSEFWLEKGQYVITLKGKAGYFLCSHLFPIEQTQGVLKWDNQRVTPSGIDEHDYYCKTNIGEYSFSIDEGSGYAKSLCFKFNDFEGKLSYTYLVESSKTMGFMENVAQAHYTRNKKKTLNSSPSRSRA